MATDQSMQPLNYFYNNANESAFPNAAKFGDFLYNLQGANSANAFTASENEKQRMFDHNEAIFAYNRELNADATAIQRRVQDLEAAGFNPLMAVANGISPGNVSSSAASSGAGSGAQAAGATMLSAIFRGISQIVSASVNASSRALNFKALSNARAR